MVKIVTALAVAALGGAALFGLSQTEFVANGFAQLQLSSQIDINNFRFEEFKDAALPNAYLNKWFPKGSSKQSLFQFMKSKGGACDRFICVYRPSATDRDNWVEWAIDVRYTDSTESRIASLKVNRFTANAGKVDNTLKGFRFEKYETAEAAEADIKKQFPTGSRADDIAKLLKSAGAKCDEVKPADPKKGFGAFGCQYDIRTFSLGGITWYGEIIFDKNRKMTDFGLGRNLNVP